MDKKKIGIVIVVLLALYGYFAFNSYKNEQLAKEKQTLEVQKQDLVEKEKEQVLEKEQVELKDLEEQKKAKAEELKQLQEKQAKEEELKQLQEKEAQALAIEQVKNEEIAKLQALKESSYTFNFDSNAVVLSDTQELKDFFSMLDILAERNLLKKISIDSHADNIGLKSYNLKLSLKRADEVKSKLLKYNVEIEVNPHGEMNPVAPNNTKEGRALNRRVELKIY